MAVYVDNMQGGFGRMVMCHMFAVEVTMRDLRLKIQQRRAWLADRPDGKEEGNG